MHNIQTCLFADHVQSFANTLLKAFHGSNVRILLCQGGSSKTTTFSAVADLVSSIIWILSTFVSQVACKEVSPRSALLKTEIILRCVFLAKSRKLFFLTCFINNNLKSYNTEQLTLPIVFNYFYVT